MGFIIPQSSGKEKFIFLRNIKSLPYLPSGKRFKDKVNHIPGPGKYDPKQNYFIKGIKTTHKPFGFGKDTRKSMELKGIISNLFFYPSLPLFYRESRARLL